MSSVEAATGMPALSSRASATDSAPSRPPTKRLPASPMKIFAGGWL
jgi:hypothetical protein